jgi:hypothetical protein
MNKLINKKEGNKNSSIDQAGLDLGFIEAFIDLLWGLCDSKGTLDSVKTGTISALCFESRFKIDNLHKFIASVPFDTDGNMYTKPRKKA